MRHRPTLKELLALNRVASLPLKTRALPTTSRKLDRAEEQIHAHYEAMRERLMRPEGVWQLAVFRAAEKIFLASGCTATPEQLFAAPEVHKAWNPRGGNFSLLPEWRKKEWGRALRVTPAEVKRCLTTWQKEGHFGLYRPHEGSVILTALLHWDAYARTTLERCGADLSRLALSFAPAVMRGPGELHGRLIDPAVLGVTDGAKWTEYPEKLAAIADDIGLTETNAVWIANALPKIRAELTKPAASWEVVASMLSLNALVPDEHLRGQLSAVIRRPGGALGGRQRTGSGLYQFMQQRRAQLANALAPCGNEDIWANIQSESLKHPIETEFSDCRYVWIREIDGVARLFWGEKDSPGKGITYERARYYMKKKP